MFIKGLPVKISIQWCLSVPEDCFYHSKQCRPQWNASWSGISDQGLHCLFAECSIKIWLKMKNTTQHPFKRNWTCQIDKSGKFHSACFILRAMFTIIIIHISMPNLGYMGYPSLKPKSWNEIYPNKLCMDLGFPIVSPKILNLGTNWKHSSMWVVSILTFESTTLLMKKKSKMDIPPDSKGETNQEPTGTNTYTILLYRTQREKTCLRGLRTTKAQTSLPMHTGWSAPLLFAFCKVSYQNLL